MDANVIGKAELLGLPGVGKTHVLNEVDKDLSINLPLPSHKAAERKKLNKTVNVLRGGLMFPNLIFVLVLNFLKNRKKITSGLQYFRMVIVLLERSGEVNSRQVGTSDEGIYQAIWGILFRCRVPVIEEMNLLSKILSILSVDVDLIFISSSKKVHFNRYLNRLDQRCNDFFEFTNMQNYLHGRHVLAVILTYCKKNDISVSFFSNP